MAGDDLHTPLGVDRDADAADPATGGSRGALGLGAIGLVCAGLAGVAWWTDNGMGGEPFTISPIEIVKQTAPEAPKPPLPAVSADEATGTIPAATGRANAEDVEASSGVRVIRQGGGIAPGAQIIQVPKRLGIELPPAPDRRVVEKGKYGLLPKIGGDGSRPSDVYARPLITSMGVRPGAPRIALVVGGMGLSEVATRAAMEKLPGDVTFAFAPYGVELARQTAQARADGHELVLQLPMEGLDGVDMNGSRTLTTELTADQFADRLAWHLSRFTGYVGVENFLGARFTAREASVKALLSEIGGRGLIYLDDGSSPTSLVPSVGAALHVVAGRADVVIDADRAPDAVAAALARLEAIARKNGSAIGSMSALPVSVEQAARFIQGLEKRGVALAPLSAVIGKPPGPGANINR